MDKKNKDTSKVEHHKTKRNPIVFALSVLLLVIIAVAFVFTPGLISPTNTVPDLGSYDGKKIKYDEEFVNLVEYFTNQLEAQGTQGDPMFSAMTNAFNYAILTEAFVDEVEKSGYVVPTSLANREMVQYFQDENGVYSERLFQSTPEGTKIHIKEATVEGIKRNLYYTDLTSLKTSSSERAFLQDMNKNQRSFNMVSFDTDNYPREEVVTFGTNNAELFTTYSMDVITVNDESTAKTVANRIANNELTFADAITEYSTDQYSNDVGLLNDNLHYKLKDIVKGEDTFNTLISLESGSVSDIIETKTGYSIFSVKANPTLADFTNDSLIDSVYTYITIYEAGIIEDYFINLSKDFKISAVMLGYEQAKALYDVESVAIEAFPINYGSVELLEALPTQSASSLAQAQANEQFYKAAFSLEADQYSEPIVLGKDIIVLSLVDEIVEDSENATFDFIHSYYVQQYDASDVSSYFMTSDKVENNLFSVLLEYFL